MLRKYHLLPLIFISSLACGQTEYEFNTASTERILSVLTADEMRGRATFSPEIDLAAGFIAGEFEEIGLETIDGQDNYLQSFAMYTIEVESSELKLDGREIEESEYIAIPNEESFQINQSEQIQYISASEDFRSRFNEISSSETDQVVLVDTIHRDIFSRFARFYRRPSTVSALGEDSNLVFALYAGMNPQEVEVKVSSNVTEKPLKNVVGMISGKRKNEFVLFSAHYDHIGIRPAVEGDSIANGANDDASGTAAVIELARYFRSFEKPERSLLFVAFTGEEVGGYGSRYFSNQVNPDEIVAMFNIEMIGKPAVEGPNTAWITGFDKSNFGELLQESVAGSIYSFYPDPYPTQNLFYRSDNATLARLGVPAHSISTTPIDVDPDYHKVSDEIQTLDLDHLTNTIKAIAAGAKEMVSGKLTPTRVDPENVN